MSVHQKHDDVDRGRAWLVLAAVYSAVIFLCTILYMNGLYLAVLVEQYDEDLTKTSMIGALNSALLCLLAPVVSIFMDTYSCRICMVTGALLLCISYFISFFFKSVNVYIFTIGIIGGIGNSFAAIPPSVLLAYHFDKWRNICLSFKEVIVGFGMFVASPVLFWFTELFGINGSFLIVSGLALQISICGLLCAPNSEEKKFRKSKLNEDSGNRLAHSNIFMQRVKSSISLSFALYTLHIGASGVLSLAAILFPVYGTWTSAGFLLSGLCGFYTGVPNALMVTITISLVGVEKLSSAYGLAFFFCGVGVLAGPPLFGIVYEATDSYDYCFMTLGLIGLLGVSFSLVAFSGKHSQDNEKEIELEVPTNDDAVLTDLLGEDKMNGAMKITDGWADVQN